MIITVSFNASVLMLACKVGSINTDRETRRNITCKETFRSVQSAHRTEKVQNKSRVAVGASFILGSNKHSARINLSNAKGLRIRCTKKHDKIIIKRFSGFKRRHFLFFY